VPNVCHTALFGSSVHVSKPSMDVSPWSPPRLQVLMRGFILAHGYETSYTCLARRAAKTNNIWNRLVRRGSIWMLK